MNTEGKEIEVKSKEYIFNCIIEEKSKSRERVVCLHLRGIKKVKYTEYGNKILKSYNSQLTECKEDLKSYKEEQNQT